MKNTAKITIFVVAFILSLLALRSILPQKVVPSETPDNQRASEAVGNDLPVRITIDDSEHIATYSAEATGTVFDALTHISQEERIELTFETYDFGVFVESIQGKKNSDEKAWIYFVNGQSPAIAADKYELQSADSIEWKYIEPEF